MKGRNRTLVEAARTMLIFSWLPEFLWAEAVATTCFTQNQELKVFLDSIHQSPRGIFISQSQYAIELLKKHGLDECVSMSTPMATERLDADLQGTSTDQTTYRRMIRRLMYLTASRPDIAFATFVCARYQARPTVKHLKEGRYGYLFAHLRARFMPRKSFDTLADNLHDMKFERNTIPQTTCRTPTVRLRDQDDPHDDAHPEGENSAKRQKTSDYYDWETATYGKIWCDENVHNLRSVETEFPTIVFNDTLTSKVALSCEPTVSPFNDNQIDFRMSFDESDDEDYPVIYDKNSFSYKIIYVKDLKTDSENDNVKVDMPSFSSSLPMVSYYDDFDYFKNFEKEFSAIAYNDALTSKLDFSEHTGIKREFSVARTPQQNGVAERKNRTLIEGFSDQASQQDTNCSYTLLYTTCVRPPSISFMRPFGCPVTILNTLDPLGKFNEKADEGFFVGYSINNKALRVFNTGTRKVEENLHITFLENKPNVVGSGPDWLFDIDLLTNSMNYEPVTAGNQTNKNAGIKDNVDAVPTQQYILLPLLYDSPQSSEDAVTDDAGKKTNEDPAKEDDKSDPGRERVQRNEFESVFGQDKDANGNSIYSMFTLVYAAGSSCDNLGGSIPDTGIFSSAYDDEDVGAEADLNNLETTMNVSPIPTTRIHKDYPKEQIIGFFEYLHYELPEDVVSIIFGIILELQHDDCLV
ncbi:ribonuclease H-like domain-containing protein [Tanacetum coccineum]